MKLDDKTLSDILVKSGYISEKDFNEISQDAKDLGRDVVDIIVFRGYLGESEFGKLVADYYKVGYVNLSRTKIDQEVINKVPEKLAKTYKIIPFGLKDDTLMLAMSDPKDFEAVEFARRHTGLTIQTYYAPEKEIRKALGQYKKDIKKDFDEVISEAIKRTKKDQDDLEKAAEKLPVIKILDTILAYAIAEGASDIHIETQEDNVIIRFRVDGILQDIIKHPRGIEEALVARVKILSNLKIDEHRIPQDGRYKFNVNDEVIALRISIIPGFYGENVVMRVLRESQRPLSLEELGLMGGGLDIVKTNIGKPHGMILVTGPTGSGKTTTLYSVLNILNTIGVKVCTIEDPIEYGMGRVNQIQVNPKTGLTFAAGLRALLRHDPDIIMVGEIRDKETAEIAVHAALTGHLVLSTLHTNTAAGAIPRLIDMGVEDFLLASTLNVVIAQRLVRKINKDVIEKYEPDSTTLKKFESLFSVDMKNKNFYRGKEDVEGTKPYKGRVGLYEVLPVTESVRKAIVSKSSSEEIQKVAVGEGMITMLEDGLNKISSGVTTIEEAIRVIQDV